MDQRFDDALFEDDLDLLRLETEWENLRTAVIDAARGLSSYPGNPEEGAKLSGELRQKIQQLDEFELKHPHFGVETTTLVVGMDQAAPGSDKTILSIWSEGKETELGELRDEMYHSSLGDQPHSISANKLKRLIDLETEEHEHRRSTKNGE